MSKAFNKEDVDPKNKLVENKASQVMEGSSEHELVTILEGVKTILSFFLKLKPASELDLGRDRMGSSSKLFDFTKMFTLGLFSSRDDKAQNKTTFDFFKETCECLLYDIK